MDYKNLILIVEDEKNIRKFIGASLETQGYVVKFAKDGEEGIRMALSYNPDLILLDLGLPDMEGLEFIKKVKEFLIIPIIIVSARENERDKVTALDLGAEDYITKPFSLAELLARVRVALRRKNNLELEGKEIKTIYQFEGLYINIESREVRVNDEKIHLTPIEYKILLLLIKHQGKVLTHNFIIKEIWGTNINSETQGLRVFMASLRRKLESDKNKKYYIYTEIGVGYKFNC
ncbi:MAG: response regulator [Sarcina sp.]